MTATTNSRTTTTPAMASPIPVPRLAPQRRWRPGLVALAVALVATGGLSAAYAITLVGATGSYLAISRPVQAGSQVSAADLITVRISADPALRPIPAGRSRDVIGKYAAVRLFKGALLTEDQLTDVPIGGSGTYLVSIGLSSSKVPAQRVRPGSKVILVATPPQSFGNQTQTGPPQTFGGTVADVSPPSQNGTVYVNVAVPENDGPTVATLAAAERIVIVLAGG